MSHCVMLFLIIHILFHNCVCSFYRNSIVLCCARNIQKYSEFVVRSGFQKRAKSVFKDSLPESDGKFSKLNPIHLFIIFVLAKSFFSSAFTSDQMGVAAGFLLFFVHRIQNAIKLEFEKIFLATFILFFFIHAKAMERQQEP